MAYFGRVPFLYDEYHEGHTGDQAPYPVYHSDSNGDIHLGFDQIADEVSNEFFFYGSSHSHHHEEHFFTSDNFGLNVPEKHFCGQPPVAYDEIHPANPVSHWQQGTVSPAIGFKSSLLSDDRNFSLVDSYPYSQEREIFRGNHVTTVPNAFDSNVEIGNTYFQIGFDDVDAQRPVFLDNYPFAQVREESRNGEGYLINSSNRYSIGPTWPSSSGHDREVCTFSDIKCLKFLIFIACVLELCIFTHTDAACIRNTSF